MVPLPPEIADATGPVTVTITAVDARTTIDRRYGDPRTLPAAISELTGTDGIEETVIDAQANIGVECEPWRVPRRVRTRAHHRRPGRPGVVLDHCRSAPRRRDGDGTSVQPAVARRRIERSGRCRDGHTWPDVDRVVLADSDVPPPATDDSLIAVDVRRNDPRARTVEVAPCPDGCWVVFGEGFNTDWEAT